MSKRTGKSIENKKEEDGDESMRKSLPIQLPKGIKEEEIRQQAEAGANSMTFLIIFQVVLQLFMEQSIDSLWSMFFILQLVKSLTFFGIKIPANALIYIEELRKFIDFEMLSPDFVL